MGVRRNEEQGRALVNEFQASGLGSDEFARRKKISRSTLDRWLSRVGPRDLPSFLPVTIAPETPARSPMRGAGVVRLVLPSGVSVEASASCDPASCEPHWRLILRALWSFPRILLHRGVIDFRKGRRSLAALVEAELRESPFSTTLFLFMSRRRDTIRALYWDKTGFALWEKGLEEARFPWPRGEVREGSVVLSAEQVQWLLEGIDIWKLRPHKELEYSRVC